MIIDFSKYSSVRIGGKFELEILDSVRDFEGVLIGGANNLLISPAPKKMAILGENFDFIKFLERDKTHALVRIGCKTKAAKIYRFAKENNLKGLEFLLKIPGTLGGLLRMNAGLKDENISHHLVKIMSARGEILRGDIAFSYRFCPLTLPYFWAEFKLEWGFDDAKDVLLKSARSNQPSGASFGSIFKNPPGNFAGALIEAAGLKGFERGGAMISDKHANFLINKGGASFEDAIFLIELARSRVFEEFGVRLENEVIVL